MRVPEESKERGRQVRIAMTGGTAPGGPATAAAYELVPELEEWVLGNVFGEIWGRPQLDLKTRSGLVMAMLAVLGREPQLRGHVGSALNLGWTPEEIAEVFVQSLPYGGVPTALNALRVASEVFHERGLR